MSEGHACPVHRCTVTDLPMDRLMCRAHWYAVPIRLRSEVWRTWRSGSVADHAQARENAIAAVEQREPQELFA